MQHRGGKRQAWPWAVARRWVPVMVMACSSIICAASATAYAQADSAPQIWEWSLGMGIQEVASRDEAGSPLAYVGTGFPLALRAQLQRPQWSSGMQASAIYYGINGGKLQAAPATEGGESHRADSVFVDLSLWAQRAVISGESLALSAGVQLGHWTFFRSYLYNPRQIGSVETWDAVVTSDARMALEYLGQRWSWRMATSLALAGRMMRPSYSIRGDERLALVESRRNVFRYGEWTSLHRLRMVQAETSVQWNLNDRWGLWAQYRVGTLVYEADVSTRAFSQRVVSGIQLRFY